LLTRQLGASDIEVSAVILGTSQFSGMKWGPYDEKTAIDVTHAAIDSGITTIDTAPAYGIGRSEDLVGRAIAERRSEVTLATKCSLQWHSDFGEFVFERGDERVYRTLKPDSIIKECEGSLKRLRTDYIDIYQCHQMDHDTPAEDTMGALLRLKEQGKIRAIGVSNFTTDAIGRMLEVGQVDSDQPQYSLVNRSIEHDVLPFCRQRGVSILAYSPLAQGLLTGAITADREYIEGDHRQGHPWFANDFLTRVNTALVPVRDIADVNGMTTAQVVINWTVHEPGVTAALVGARSPEQAVQNAASLCTALSDEERTVIRKAFSDISPPK
jgi:methylglyoxal reductase